MNEDRNLVRSAAQTLQRVVGEYLGGQPDYDLRWQIIVIIGRYTSHIAIILVAIIAVLLAGARLNVARVTPEPIPNNPSSIVSRTDGAINPANESNILSQNIPNVNINVSNVSCNETWRKVFPLGRIFIRSTAEYVYLRVTKAFFHVF